MSQPVPEISSILTDDLPLLDSIEMQLATTESTDADENDEQDVARRHLERMRGSSPRTTKRKKKKKKKKKAKRRGSGESARSMRSLSLPTIEEDAESDVSDSDDDSVGSSASCYSYQCYHIPSKITSVDVETGGGGSGDTSDSSSLDDQPNSDTSSTGDEKRYGHLQRWMNAVTNKETWKRLFADLRNKEKWQQRGEYLSDRKNWKEIVNSRKFIAAVVVFFLLLIIIIASTAGRSGKETTRQISPLFGTMPPPTKPPIPAPTPITSRPTTSPVIAESPTFQIQTQVTALEPPPVLITVPELPPISPPTFAPTLATSTPTSTPVELPPPELSENSYYYNVGETIQTYVDAAGREWLPADIPQGGTTHSICEQTPPTAFQNTNDAQLYCSEVWIASPESLDFEFRVPNKDYQIVLHFAETFVDGPGKRVMDLYVQNSLVEANFDVFLTANGAYAATQWFGAASVTDYNLSISLKPTTQNAKLNAIEIHPAGSPRLPEEYVVLSQDNNRGQEPTPPPTDPALASQEDRDFPLLINVGSTEPITISGRKWLPDIEEYDFSSTIGTSKVNDQCTEDDVGEDQLYCSERFFRNTQGNFEIPVPRGNYLVRMHFAELFYEEAGERVFNVLVENLVVRRSFDILNQPRFSTRTSVSRQTQVVDGLLSIGLIPLVGNPTISAIEIVAL